MPNEFTPSEQRVWDAAYGSAFAKAEHVKLLSGVEGAEVDEVTCVQIADRAVAALRAHRQQHGSWIGSRLPSAGEGRDSG